MIFYLSQNDRLPTLTTQLSDSVGVVDISSGTPVLYWKLRYRPSGSGLFSGIGSIVGSPTTGLVSYTFTTGNVAYPGVYNAYWRINFSGGQSETFPNDGEKLLFEITPGLE